MEAILERNSPQENVTNNEPNYQNLIPKAQPGHHTIELQRYKMK